MELGKNRVQGVEQEKYPFKFSLYTDEERYKTTDKINIWAEVAYIGENDDVEVRSGRPVISFVISNGKGINIGGLTNDVSVATTIMIT